MEASKKAAQKVAADASNAVDNTLKGVENATNAAGQGLKNAGEVVDEKKDTLVNKVSTAAHDGAEGAAGLLNKGISAFK